MSKAQQEARNNAVNAEPHSDDDKRHYQKNTQNSFMSKIGREGMYLYKFLSPTHCRELEASSLGIWWKSDFVTHGKSYPIF